MTSSIGRPMAAGSGEGGEHALPPGRWEHERDGVQSGRVAAKKLANTLASVSRICAKGNTLVFDSEGSCILNKGAGRLTSLLHGRRLRRQSADDEHHRRWACCAARLPLCRAAGGMRNACGGPRLMPSTPGGGGAGRRARQFCRRIVATWGKEGATSERVNHRSWRSPETGMARRSAETTGAECGDDGVRFWSWWPTGGPC